MMSVSVVLLLEQNINAQVSTLGNAGFPVDYVGWDAVQFFPLNVTHRGAQNINFRTDYAAAIPGPRQPNDYNRWRFWSFNWSYCNGK